MAVGNPLIPFLVGLAAAIVLLVKLRLPAFFGLTIAAFFIALVTPEIALSAVPSTIAEAFGEVMVGIGIPILMAAIIGKSLMDSGAAERIVRGFMSIVSDDSSDLALLGSSYVLSIPVFFDNVFYLLAPIGRSMRARTGGQYPAYVSVLCAGALSAHMLIPPTPGPVAMAAELDVDLGLAMMLGIVVAAPSSVIGGVIYGRWLDDRLDIPLREAMGSTSEGLEEMVDSSTDDLPSLTESSLPIVVPVVFITSNTAAGVLFSEGSTIRDVTTFLGAPTLILTVAAIPPRSHSTERGRCRSTTSTTASPRR
jgi:GntP family gluconate:H+ symporter